MGSALNGNANIILDDEIDCFVLADASATQLGVLLNLTYNQEYLAFTTIYDNCLNQLSNSLDNLPNIPEVGRM